MSTQRRIAPPPGRRRPGRPGRVGGSPAVQVLFIHRQGPGQFAPVAAALEAVAPGSVRLVSGCAVPGLPYPVHAAPRLGEAGGGHPYLRATETAVRHAQATARAVRAILRDGFRPDVVAVHPGWGDALFLPEVLPGVPLLSYAEFFFGSAATELGFDADLAADLDQRCALGLRNAPLLFALHAARLSVSPTRWQRDLHPEPLRRRIRVVHEGVDVATVRPDPRATFRLPGGRTLGRDDEVVSYVARDLEPHRGFPAMMRSLPGLLRRRPRAEVVICGGDGVSYGRPPPGGGTWREALLGEVGPHPRVHFTGRLAYAEYVRLLQVSRLHLYPSAPFVLSWSLTEALAAGGLILASDTEPVREFIDEGRNGFLADPRDPAAFGARAAELLAADAGLGHVRAAARAGIVAGHRRDRAVERWRRMLHDAAAFAA